VNQNDPGFAYRIIKNGDVLISHKGRPATTLRGLKAINFIDEMKTSSFSEQQQLMARMTGNFKRGNERESRNHPRNRR